MKRWDLVWATGAILLAWQLLAWLVNEPILPGPVVVFQTLIQELGEGLVGHFLASAGRVVVSIMLAVLVAAPAGIILGQSERINQLLSPIVYLLYPIPKVVFVPVVLLLFGIGNFPKSS